MSKLLFLEIRDRLGGVEKQSIKGGDGGLKGRAMCGGRNEE